MIEYTWYLSTGGELYVPFAKKQAQIQTALADRLRQRYWHHSIQIDATTSIRLDLKKQGQKWYARVTVTSGAGPYFPMLLGANGNPITFFNGIEDASFSKIGLGSGANVVPVNDSAISEKVSTEAGRRGIRYDYLQSREFMQWALDSKYFFTAAMQARLTDQDLQFKNIVALNDSVATDDLNTHVRFHRQPSFFFLRSGEWWQAHSCLDKNANPDNVYYGAYTGGPDYGLIEVDGVGGYVAEVPVQNMRPFFWYVRPVFSERVGAEFGNGWSFLTTPVENFTFSLFGVDYEVAFEDGEIDGVGSYVFALDYVTATLVDGKYFYSGWVGLFVSPYIPAQWNGSSVDADVFEDSLPVDDGEIVDLRASIYSTRPRLVSEGYAPRAGVFKNDQVLQIRDITLLSGIYYQSRFLGCITDVNQNGVGGSLTITNLAKSHSAFSELSNVYVVSTPTSVGFKWDGNTVSILTPVTYATVVTQQNVQKINTTVVETSIVLPTAYDGDIELASSSNISVVDGFEIYRDVTITLKGDFALLGTGGTGRADYSPLFLTESDSGASLPAVLFRNLALLNFSYTGFFSAANQHTYGFTYKGALKQAPASVPTTHIYAQQTDPSSSGTAKGVDILRDLGQRHITGGINHKLLDTVTLEPRSGYPVTGMTYTLNYYRELQVFPHTTNYGGRNNVFVELDGATYLRSGVYSRLGYLFWWRGASLPRGVCVAECFANTGSSLALQAIAYGRLTLASANTLAADINSFLTGTPAYGAVDTTFRSAAQAVLNFLAAQTEATWSANRAAAAALARTALLASRTILVNNFADTRLQDTLYAGAAWVVGDYPTPRTPLPGRLFPAPTD